MKIKKIPMRTCVVTKTQHPKIELTRIVVNKDGIVSIDLKGKAHGRGAYLQLSREVIEKARKTNALGRALEVEIPEHIYQELLSLTNE